MVFIFRYFEGSLALENEIKKQQSPGDSKLNMFMSCFPRIFWLKS
jgi:hypothetical protein